MNNKILESFQINDLIKLKSRIVMSAMTRGFATDHRANNQIKDYYERRAKDGVGLILTEGVVIHHTADGYNNVPHIESIEQAESWIPTIKAIQKWDTKIFCQLWHCGRISHSDYTGGTPPVSSTNIPASGINRQNNKEFGVPVALSSTGIQQVHNYYLEAAEKAIKVGFDGIELHLGHGYLADQFLDARINDRNDQYGGSIENRCRFSLELVEKVMNQHSASQVAVRISPAREMGGAYDWPDLDEMLNYFIPKLWKLGVRVLDVSCARADYFTTSGRIIRLVRPMWPGVLIGGASLSVEQANKEIEDQHLDLVTWGQYILANSDFVSKIKSNEKWTPFDRSMLSELY